jgi:hypothetical protein
LWREEWKVIPLQTVEPRCKLANPNFHPAERSKQHLSQVTNPAVN